MCDMYIYIPYDASVSILSGGREGGKFSLGEDSKHGSTGVLRN